VIFKDAAYDSLDWDDDKIRLIKLHGSIRDPGDMAITIKKIAERQYDPNKQGVLNYLLSKGPHKSVIILGYSCSDVFDINPTIESIKRNRKSIYHVEHRSSNTAECSTFPTLENIGKKGDKNPFKKYPGARIFIDTNELVKRIWKRCLNEDYLYTPPSNTEESWKRFVEEWSHNAKETSDMETKYHLAAQLFWNIARLELAIKYWEKALQLSVDINDEVLIASYTGNIGLAYRDLGHYKKAIKYFSEALKIAQCIDNRAVERRQISNLGGTYRILGNPQQAIKYHKKALRIAEDLELKKGIGVSLGNLGICYDSIGDYKRAVHYYTKSIQIAGALGDKRGEANRLGNLGITYHKIGKYELSIKHHNKALSIQQSIGDRLGEGNTYNYRGQVYMSMGDYRHAKQDFRHSLIILDSCVSTNHQSYIEALQNLKKVEDIVG
jgi:tetratricopeptide (TPR) repeat protein